MIKKNLKTLIVTSIIILLPIVAGVFLWDKLPEEMPVHFNAQGVADGYGSKATAVFFMPLFMLALQWICMVVTSLDPKKQNITEKNINLVLWLIPSITVLTCGAVYAYAFNLKFNINTAVMIFFGLLFIVVGNYMPKCKQNYTIGIKIPWTLDSNENWNYTHRLAGKVWVGGGIVILATAFLNLVWLSVSVFVIMVAVPFIGSYLFYKKESKK